MKGQWEMSCCTAGSANLRPMRRLASNTVLVGFMATWFLAASPIRRSVSVNPTYEGVVRLPCSFCDEAKKERRIRGQEVRGRARVDGTSSPRHVADAMEGTPTYRDNLNAVMLPEKWKGKSGIVRYVRRCACNVLRWARDGGGRPTKDSPDTNARVGGAKVTAGREGIHESVCEARSAPLQQTSTVHKFPPQETRTCQSRVRPSPF